VPPLSLPLTAAALLLCEPGIAVKQYLAWTQNFRKILLLFEVVRIKKIPKPSLTH